MHAFTDSNFLTGPLADLEPCAAECPDAKEAATSTGSTANSGRRILVPPTWWRRSDAVRSKDNRPNSGFPNFLAAAARVEANEPDALLHALEDLAASARRDFPARS
jgi:hypothetical protein